MFTTVVHHTPYPTSLTPGKTALIVCASPADADVTETLSTLRFASRAKYVRNVARVNAVIDPSSLHAHQTAEALQAHLDKESRKLVAAREQSEKVAAHAISLALSLGLQKKQVDAKLKSLEHAHQELQIAKHAALERATSSEEREVHHVATAGAERAAATQELEAVQEAHAQKVAALEHKV